MRLCFESNRINYGKVVGNVHHCHAVQNNSCVVSATVPSAPSTHSMSSMHTTPPSHPHQRSSITVGVDKPQHRQSQPQLSHGGARVASVRTATSQHLPQQVLLPSLLSFDISATSDTQTSNFQLVPYPSNRIGHRPLA